jgi:flagellar protein FliS
MSALSIVVLIIDSLLFAQLLARDKFMDDPNQSITSQWTGRTQTGERYLESVVQTASPARLRLMLIERSVEVCASLAEIWRGKQDLGPNAQSLKLLELLNELLRGVVGGKEGSEQEVSRKVADLYVFLAKHLVKAEGNSDADSIDEIRSVLEIEAETWRMVCSREAGFGSPPSVAFERGGLSFEV